MDSQGNWRAWISPTSKIITGRGSILFRDVVWGLLYSEHRCVFGPVLGDLMPDEEEDR